MHRHLGAGGMIFCVRDVTQPLFAVQTVEAVSDSLKFRIPEVARRDVYLKDLRRHPTTGKLYWRSNLEELKRRWVRRQLV